MNLDIKVNDSKLRRNMRKAPLKVRAALQQGVNAAAIYIQREMKQAAPVHDSGLRDSVKVETGNLKADVSPTADYAIFVEKGTRPHYPPLDAIRKWADDHGIPPFLVQRSIGQKGTKANPFVANTYKDHRRAAERLGAKIVSKRLRKL